MQSIQKITYCKECSTIIGNNTRTGLCHSCYSKLTRKCEWPTKAELYTLLLHNSFCAVGRMYGVDSNAVRKWCNKYNIPSHAKDYK